MKEKIKQFKIDLDYLVEFTQAEAHYEGKRELPHAAVVAGVLFDITVRHWVARLTCHLRGHQMVDTSFGGPEGGYVDICCERCGLVSHQVLY